MTYPLTKVAAGPIPARLSLPLAKSQSFTNLALVGISNGSYSGGAGYGLPISSTNAPYIAYAVGEFASGTPGTNGAFGSSAANIYQPLTTPSTSDGLYSANVNTGAAMLLPDSSAPSGSTVCSIATNGLKVYTTDGQSCLCFLGPTGPAAALTAGYVLAGQQIEYNPDGDNKIAVLVQPWLNADSPVIIAGVIAVTAAASSITLAGAAIGDKVVAALDITAGGTDVSNGTTGAFEAIISVAGKIQQLVATTNDGITTSDKVFILLQRN